VGRLGERGAAGAGRVYGAFLVFGGAMHVDQEDLPRLAGRRAAPPAATRCRRAPVLGVCLGGQLLAKALHGHVRRLPSPEIGWVDVELTPEAEADPVFSALPARFPSFQWHLYHFEQPEGAVPLARSARCLQAFRAGRAAWGVQFHPEVRHASVEHWTRSYDPQEDGPVDVPALLAETGRTSARGTRSGWELCGGSWPSPGYARVSRRDHSCHEPSVVARRPPPPAGAPPPARALPG
jgi:GMP synthase-like glutamine amidotransferase